MFLYKSDQLMVFSIHNAVHYVLVFLRSMYEIAEPDRK